MSGLISGADALRALTNNVGVEFKCGGSSWRLLDSKQQPVEILMDPFVKFRLKQSIVKLEVEVPAPFEPKEGDSFWILSTNYDCGYIEVFVYRNDEQGKRLSQFGTWRTEEEVKKVVEQLRKLGALK